MWRSRTSIRLAVAAFGFGAALFLPWWAPALAITVLALFWRSGEAMFLGLFVDFLWLPIHTLPVFTIGACLAVWLLEPIRKEFLTE